jgi:GTP cyclohydrolase II
MTNNPAKANFLIEAGIPVNSYVPVIVGEALHNLGYLETKRSKMGHRLPELIAQMEK